MAATSVSNQLGSSDESPTATATSGTAGHESYGQILKSSALIGGAQFLNIGIGILRTKVMAILLGPAGFGLAGLYSSVLELTQSVAGMGVNSSGVRQIAGAIGDEDKDRIGLTVAVLRQTSTILGILGSLLLVVFCRQVSQLTFGSPRHAIGVALLAIAVFFKLVSGGQGALIQGMRRISELAKINVLGSLLGAITGVILVYAFREDGIVPYLVSVAAMTTVISWWYSRRIQIPVPQIRVLQVAREASALLKLGFAFMISSMMTLGVAYGVRVIVLQKGGLSATGYYQSAWTIGGLYVGFILQAMAADFYPRLTAKINDHQTCNRLVNEQAHVGLLLAAPGVIATLVFAPSVISILYSAKFGASVPILRWVCLGSMLQVISWPMGFIIVAKGRQSLFIFSEVAWAIASIGLAWLCVSYFGTTGAGIAFFLSYIFHAFLTYALVNPLSGFRWSQENYRAGLLFLGIIGLVFFGLHFLPSPAGVVLGAVAAVFSSGYSLWVLARLIPIEDVPHQLRRIIVTVRGLLPGPYLARG